METIGPKKWGSVFLGEEKRLFLVNPVVSSDSQIHKVVYRNTLVLVSISSSQGTGNLVLELISYKNIKQIVFKQLRDCPKKKIEPVSLKVKSKPRTLET